MKKVGSTPKKKPPWNCYQPKNPGTSSALNSVSSTTRVAYNKENFSDNSVVSSISSAHMATTPSVYCTPRSTRTSQHNAAIDSVSGDRRNESMTCSDLLKEVLASAAAVHNSQLLTQHQDRQQQDPIQQAQQHHPHYHQQQQQHQSAATTAAVGGDCGDHVTAMRGLIGQLGGRVAHRPDCIGLLSELDRRLTLLEGDVSLVTGQLMLENRKLRGRAQRSEAALAAARSEAGARAADWGRREAAAAARVQAAEARAVAMETELREAASRQIFRLTPQTPAAVTAGSNAVTASVPSKSNHGNLQVLLQQRHPLTVANVALHRRAMAATTDENIDHDATSTHDCAVTSVSQQQRHLLGGRPSPQAAPPPPPLSISDSPPTLDSAPASGLPSIPARYPAAAAAAASLFPRNLYSPSPSSSRSSRLPANSSSSSSSSSSFSRADDEAEFHRGLARIEEQIVRLQTSLGGGGVAASKLAATS